ncbi:MAG TPA: FAD:protein FMN transferase [Lysobacter sp.]|nr:FAD:protein FMN transferase [Lysobacter sp.]
MHDAPATVDRRVVHALGGTSMGTTWSVKCAAAPGVDLRPLHAGIQARLDEVVAQMSNWTPDSVLSRFNAAPAGSWHTLPAELSAVLERALRIARITDGAFDPTVGALVDAWGFGPSGTRDAAPDPAMLHALRLDAGWERLVLEPGGRALQPGGLMLDLCAIAKGFAVDHVAAHLRGLGIGAALVEVGGELYGYGCKPDGSPWRVVVEAWSGDENDDAPARILALDGRAVATSGDRWHGVRHEGRRHCHTLDPRAGVALHDAPTAVTVVADAAMDADAWATALTVLGEQRGFDLACAQGLAARFVGPRSAGRRERMTPRFEALLAA